MKKRWKIHVQKNNKMRCREKENVRDAYDYAVVFFCMIFIFDFFYAMHYFPSLWFGVCFFCFFRLAFYSLRSVFIIRFFLVRFFLSFSSLWLHTEFRVYTVQLAWSIRHSNNKNSANDESDMKKNCMQNAVGFTVCTFFLLFLFHSLLSRVCMCFVVIGLLSVARCFVLMFWKRNKIERCDVMHIFECAKYFVNRANCCCCCLLAFFSFSFSSSHSMYLCVIGRAQLPYRIVDAYTFCALVESSEASYIWRARASVCVRIFDTLWLFRVGGLVFLMVYRFTFYGILHHCSNIVQHQQQRVYRFSRFYVWHNEFKFCMISLMCPMESVWCIATRQRLFFFLSSV